MQAQGSNAPIAPAIAPTPQAPVAVTASGASAAEIYEALRNQRRELTRQLETLEETRRGISNELQDQSISPADRAGLQTRMTGVDQQIASLDQEIAASNAQVAKAAAVPGAIVEEPAPPSYNGPPEEAYVLSGIFLLVVLFPLSVAFARRIWRKSAVAVTTFPKELTDRLFRLEQTVESSAVEIERIGEGQRFLTRLFTEGAGARALGAPQEKSNIELRR
ncbi:MAG TPA: hypothetical protein VIF83_08760 [Gemmatimonadaceae bacterium]|jgi:hypothetical protein